jgi:hypothetical protein
MTYEGVSKSFRTGCLEREMQMIKLFATRRSYISTLWVSLVSFAAINLCIASQRLFIIVVYFVIDWVQKLLDIPAYIKMHEYVGGRVTIAMHFHIVTGLAALLVY